MRANERCVFLTQLPGPPAVTFSKRVWSRAPLHGDGKILPSSSRSLMYLGLSASVQALCRSAGCSAYIQSNACSAVWNYFGVLDNKQKTATSDQGNKGSLPRGPNMTSTCRGTAMTLGGASRRRCLARQFGRVCAAEFPPSNSSPRPLVSTRRSLLPPSGG